MSSADCPANVDNVAFNSLFTISGDTPTRTGYTFAGWSTSDVTGSLQTYSASGTFTMPNKAVTLTATWTANQYSVIYAAAPGDVVSGLPSQVDNVAFNSLFTISGDTPTRTGYTFAGWSTSDVTGSLQTYSAGGTFTMPNKAVTLTATWTANQYSVIYAAAPGDVVSGLPSQVDNVAFNSLFTISGDTPTRTGYTFAGWSTSDVTGSLQTYSAGGTFTMPNKAVTLTATWTANQYSVIYAAAPGDVVSGLPSQVDNVAFNSLFTISGDTPTRTGYTFAGWSTSDVTGSLQTYSAGGTFTMPNKAVTLTATWTANQYSVIYAAAPGDVVSGLPSQVDNVAFNSLFTISGDTPTRTGYTFAGWSTSDVTGSLQTYSAGGTFTMPNKAVTLTATWTANQYSVIYAAAPGDVVSGLPSQVDNVAFNSLFTISGDTPTRTGYTFAGWSTSDVTGSLQTYSAGGTFTMPNKAVTLTATWTANQYSVIYAAAPGDVVSGLPSQVDNVAFNSLFTISGDTPTRTGYTFAGWSTSDVTGSLQTYSASGTFTMPNKAVTLTATWTANQYSVIYAAAPGDVVSGLPSQVDNVAFNSLFTISGDTPTRTGYTFAGWSTSDVTGSLQTYSASGTFTMPNKAVTLTATWTANQYSVIYAAAPGDVVSGLPSQVDNVAFNSLFTISGDTPTRTGYTFAGWSTSDVTGSLQTYSASGTFTMPNKAVTLTATWTANQYSVIYAAAPGDVVSGLPSQVDNVAFNSLFTISGDTPTRTGYTFAGWSTSDVTGSLQTYSAGGTFTMPNKAVTLTAVWEIEVYDITYVLNADTISPADNSMNPASYDINDTPLTLLKPTRSGYSFVSWSDDGVISAGSTGPKTFTASWTLDDYTITYINMEGATNPSANLTSYNYYTPTFTLTDPTRSGYYFTGWSEDDTTIDQHSTGNLTFTANWAKLIDLTLTANSAKFDYDNTTKSVSGFTSSDSALTFGETTTAGASRRLVGVTTVNFANTSGLIIYKDGVDVTKQYSVTFVPGSLMIRPRITYVASVNNAVLFTEWVDYGTGDASYGLTPPKNISYRGSNYYFTGSYDPAAWNDVTANKTIKAVYAANKVLRISANSDSRVYNGSLQTITTGSLSDPSLTVTGYSIYGAGTDVGFYGVTVTLNSDFKIMSGGVDVTYQYDVRTIPGVLSITPATFPVTSSGYTGVYNGEPHGITAGTTVEGATIRYSLLPIIYPNQSTSQTLTNVGSRTVYFLITMPNYIPYYGSETINITRAPIQLTAQSNDFTYDGTAHTWHYYDITGGAFVGTQGLSGATFSPTSTVTNVADSGKANVITGVTFAPGTLPGNYAMSYMPGVLNVLKSEAMGVKADTYSELYDGSAHGITAGAYDSDTLAAITAGTEIRYSTSAHADPADYLLTESPKATHVADSQIVYFVATNPNYLPAFRQHDDRRPPAFGHPQIRDCQQGL